MPASEATFPAGGQVVEEELRDLGAHGVTERTTPEEFATKYLATRPMGFGSHSLLGRGLYALQVRRANILPRPVVVSED
jgi:hypothetical protein